MSTAFQDSFQVVLIGRVAAFHAVYRLTEQAALQVGHGICDSSNCWQQLQGSDCHDFARAHAVAIAMTLRGSMLCCI